MQIKYEIGQEVWRATCNREETSVECPDCGGTGRIRVTFHDDTTVSIDCQRCALGYEPPTGRIAVYDRVAKAERVTITGIDVRSGEEPEYRTNVSYIIDENRLFETREEALACAEKLAEEWDREEREKIAKKEKDTRSWAWNASYHRNCIKRAEREIEHHTAKLNVASLKAKEQKARATPEERE